MSEVVFPRRFRERCKLLMRNRRDYKLFLEHCKRPLRKSIRINTLKAPLEEVVSSLEAKGFVLKRIPWCEQGFWVEERGRVERVGLTLEHFLGHYYIQEAASMIPPVVLNPKPGEVVLDLTAAPGSKTTQMAQLMRNEGLIVANDNSSERVKILIFNLEKLGVVNTVVLQKDGRRLRTKLEFDKVLVDPSCSSEGVVRKDWKTLADWSEAKIKKLSRLQKALLLNAFKLLKEGGSLVYSTCTLAPEENEGVIDYLLRREEAADVERIKLEGVKARKGVTSWMEESYSDEVKKCIRIYPQDNDTEAFFVAKLRKA